MLYFLPIMLQNCFIINQEQLFNLFSRKFIKFIHSKQVFLA